MESTTARNMQPSPDISREGEWLEDEIPRIESLLRLKPLPLDFAVPSHIDPCTLGDAASEICKELLSYTRKAYGVEVFSGEARKKITREGTAQSRMAAESGGEPKPKTRFITISEEAKQVERSIMSWLSTEVFMAIAHLYRWAYELELLAVEAMKILPEIQLPQTQTQETMGPFSKKWRVLVVRFYHLLMLWLSRHPEHLPQFENYLPSMRSAIERSSYTRHNDLFNQVWSRLRILSQAAGRKRPLILDSASDAILLPQPDFSYPLGTSMFEMAYVRMMMGQGYARLGKVTDVMRHRGMPTDMPRKVNELVEKVTKDVSAELQLAVKDIPTPGVGEIRMTARFLGDVGRVVANNFLDFIVCTFNYAVANTDAASGTTIHLRAIKNQLMMQQAEGLFSASPDAVMFISAMCVNVAKRGKEIKRRS